MNSSNLPQTWQSLVQQHRARVGIVGLGYAGLPLALRFAEAGFPVLGLDIDAHKVEYINSGRSYIGHITDASIAQAQPHLEATQDFARATECDALIICVPTPLGVHQEPDLSFVRGTMSSLLPHVRAGQLLALESTTYPGTTEEEIVAPLKRAGWRVGEDVFVVYSPEREDPGNALFDTSSTPKLVGGVTPTCLAIGQALYGAVVEKIVPVSSPQVAEMAKLLENIYRAVNIGLVNELKVVADQMGIDIWEVIDAAATKPFGFTPFYPGPGLGGHCIPVDPFYLTWKAREYQVHTRFIELAGQINLAMPEWVIGKVALALSDQAKPLRSAKVLVLGIAYKKNVDDVRESPSVELMQLLQDRGAHISYSDPHVPQFPSMRRHSFELSSLPLTPEDLAQQDCIIIATDHDAFNYELILEYAPLIVDTRGRYREGNPKVIKA